MMEAYKSQDLSSASWRSRRTDVVSSSPSPEAEKQEHQCCRSSPDSGKREAQEELMLQFQSTGRK